MNVTLPDVFDLSSLSRALDEDIAAQEYAAIDYVPMDVDDEWIPAPVLHMDNAPRPWYNPEPQPAWNNLELELEDPGVENASQDVPGWYVNLREPNDQTYPSWPNFLPVVSVRRVENTCVREAPTPTPPVPAPRPWHNPEPQPAWNNLELELEHPSVKDVPGWYVDTCGQNDQPRHTWRNLLPVVSVRRVENAHVRNRAPTPPVPAPRPWHNPEPQPVRNNLELGLANPPVENAPQVQNQDVPGSYVNLCGQKDQPHPTGRYLPVVSVKRIENARVRKAPASAPTVPMVLDRNEQKTCAPVVPSLATKIDCVPGSAVKVVKVPVRVVHSQARKAGKARVPGIPASTRKADNACVLTSVRKTCALDVPASARKAEKSRAPSTSTPFPRSPVPSESISIRSMSVVPPRIDFTNMSSSSKVKLEDMLKVDELPVPMCISWPTLAYIIQPRSPKATTFYQHRNSPITQAHQAHANEDVVVIENNLIDPTVSVSTTKDEDTTSDDTHLANLTESLQLVVDHAEDGEPTVDRNAAPEDDVGTSADAKEEDSVPAENVDEDGEDKSEESEEETEEERQARVAQLMTEVFGDGEDSDDEEPPSAKDVAVSLDHASTSAASDALTVDATESITDWSLDTPDDAGTEGNGSVEVADRDEEEEESRANYRAQLLADIFGDNVEEDHLVQEVPVPMPATKDPRKRKREDDGPLPIPCLVTMDPRKRKRDDDTPPTPTLVTRDPRKRKREDDRLPIPLTPTLVTRDPRKRRREDDTLPIPPTPTLVTRDPRKRRRENGTSLIPPTPTLVTRDPRKRKREEYLL